MSKQIEWVLNEAIPEIILSKQSIALDSNNLTDTFTITTNSDGNLSVISSDDSIAIVSLSGNTVIVEALANGTVTITVNVAENSNYLSGSASLPVNVYLVNTTLNNNSWETISQMSQSRTASNYWSVGDNKEVVLNGRVDSKSFSNYSCYATILGFNHNSSYEGSNKIHFIIEKDSSGKNIMFYPFKANTSNTNAGGWNGSNMKKTYMPAFKNCLPVELQAVLKTVTKYTDNTGSNNISSDVTTTTEEVFLLSEFEVQGTRVYANQYEQNKQAQYDYYKNGNSKVRYKDTDGKVDYWWLRSTSCDWGSVSGRWCNVQPGGYAGSGNADGLSGVVPAFVV